MVDLLYYSIGLQATYVGYVYTFPSRSLPFFFLQKESHPYHCQSTRDCLLNVHPRTSLNCSQSRRSIILPQEMKQRRNSVILLFHHSDFVMPCSELGKQQCSPLNHSHSHYRPMDRLFQTDCSDQSGVAKHDGPAVAYASRS
jgi:hypothetical protein